MTEKQQIAQIHDIIAGVLIGSIKSYDAAISIHKLASDGDLVPKQPSYPMFMHDDQFSQLTETIKKTIASEMNGKLDAKLAPIYKRFDNVDKRFDRIDEDFIKLNDRLDKMDERIDANATSIRGLQRE